MNSATPRIFRFSSFIFLLFVGLLVLPNGFAKEKEKKAKVKTEVEKKAGEIVIPQVEFADTPVWDSTEFLVQRSRELDADESDPQKRGVNVVLVGDYGETRVSMRLSQTPLDATLQVLADMVDARLEARTEVIFINRDDSYDVVSRKNYGESLEAKLRGIVVPSVEFQDTPLRDAVDFLQQRSVELDTGEGGPRKGVNVILKDGTASENLSLSLKNVSLYSALEALALAAGHEMEIREHLVYLRPQTRRQQGSGPRPRRSSPQQAAP